VRQLRHFALQGFDFRPEDELLGFQHTVDRLEDFLPDAGVLRFEIQERELQGCVFSGR
jgi:hypothetical protein